MGNRLVVAALALLVVVNIVLFYAVFRRDSTSPTPEASTPAATRTSRPSVTVARTPSSSPRPSRSTVPTVTPSPTRSTTPTPTPTPTPTTTPTTTGTSSPPGGGIEIAPTSYVAEPFQTVRISGRYPGTPARTTLRVEHLERGAWRRFPLPTTTTPSGRFSAYVELGGRGRHLVRVVDPVRGVTSPAVTVSIL